MRKVGKVYICGSGPGDPKLITIKAIELLKKCDIVLYDRLVSKEIINQIPSKCERIYVGKSSDDPAIQQNKTNNLMVEHAKKGKKVLRLKGGDPFMFGRGGEEAEYLVQHNVKFEIVPGITSAIGSGAYAGIPLTHRQFSSSVAFVTGHEDPKKKEPTIRWEKLVKAVNTIVIFMGMEQLPYILYNLLKAGMRKNTQVAIIENGTTKEQRVIKSTLSNILKKAQEEKIKPPAIIIIGNVVSLHEKISWFNK